MEKQYKSLEKEKKVSTLLKKHDSLTREEVVFLIDFFIAVKNKELRTNIPYEIIDTKEKSKATYDEVQNILYLNKKKMVDSVIKKQASMSIKDFGVISNLSTINHEFRHIKQFREFKNESLLEIALLDPKNVLFAKEHLTHEMLTTLGLEDNYKLNYENLLFEYDANYHSIKNTTTWLSFFSPELTKQYMLDNHDDANYYKQSLEEVTLKQVSGNEVQKNVCKTTLFTDAALMQDPNLLRKYPILKSIYHYDGSKKTYPELMHDRTDLIDKVNFETGDEGKKAKLNKIDVFYDTLVKSDPIVTIEKKLDDIENGVLIGRDSKALDAEVKMLIDAVNDMDAQFYTYIKEIIDLKIKNYQNKKQMLNKGFTEKLKSLTEDEQELTISLRKNWLKKSEIISRQQEVLVNIFSLLNQHGTVIKEKENKNLMTNEEMTSRDAEKILKEKFCVSKADKYIFITDCSTNYKVPNFELRKMLLLGVENLIQVLNTNSAQTSLEKEFERKYLNQIRQAILVVFNFDNKRDSKENSIKTSLTILNTIYEKLETEKLEKFDALFDSLSKVSRYLLSIDEREELKLDSEVITPSRFSESIINGESYVKGLKRPEDLELEKVTLIQKTNDNLLKEKLEDKYNEYIDDASMYFEYDKKRNR